MLDTALAASGPWAGTSAACVRFMTFRRDTGVANFYHAESAGEVIASPDITLTGIAGSFTSQVGLPQITANAGYAIIAFAAGEMPTEAELIASFNKVNQTWRLPNRLLPRGWVEKFAFGS